MLTSEKKAIIFDGDDTLWKTQELYDEAKEKFKELMKIEFNEVGNIVELLDDIDAKRVDVLSFSKSRFLESMLITYAFLCGKYNKNWNVEVEKQIRNYAEEVFKLPPELYEDTIETLEALSKDFVLVLFTAGDYEVQKNKIKSLGDNFTSYFSEIYIFEMKTEWTYENIIKNLRIHSKVEKENIWVVGNSIKSDINPAVNAGLKAIWIPRKSWKYEEDKLNSDKVSIAKSLSEVKNFFQK